MPGSCDFLQGCSRFCCEPVREVIDSDLNAPFIELTVAGEAGTITVGNKSQPHRNNHAIVKSLKYGHSAGGGGGGLALEVEVCDESGGSFATFINSLITSINLSHIRTCNWMRAKWGWIETTCNGPERVNRFTVHTLQMNSIEFQYKHGLMTFNLKGTDLTDTCFETATSVAFGTAEAPIPLKRAIDEICRMYQTRVSFRRVGVDSDDAWNFGTSGSGGGGAGDPNQPMGHWQSHGENFIQAIMRWIKNYTTTNGLGITPSFSSTGPPGDHNELILWEAFTPRCDALESNCPPNSIGTYIVNGGKKSPVISFQPNLKWTFAALSEAGGASGTTTAGTSSAVGDPACHFDSPGTGIDGGMRSYNVVTEDAISSYGTRTALPSVLAAESANARANMTFGPVEGELKIQGDPLLADPVFMVGKHCALVVINPYHHQDVGGGECGDWLQAETCNAVLSNRRWMVLGSSHEIKEGSYTTTLKLKLDMANTQLNRGAPFGGDTEGFRINPTGCPFSSPTS